MKTVTYGLMLVAGWLRPEVPDLRSGGEQTLGRIYRRGDAERPSATIGVGLVDDGAEMPPRKREEAMTRRAVIALALLLALSAALPARADDAEDCGSGLSELLKTEPARAAAACRRLAEQGNAEAQSTLGGLYFSGQGVARDRAEAVKWWDLAAARGFRAAVAMRELATAHMTPSEIQQGDALAAGWKPTTDQ
jgi:TPR repeat protein